MSQTVYPFSLKLTLCQLLSFVVKRIHHFAHVLYRFQRSFVGLVHHRLLKDDQHTFSLVQDTWEDEGNSNQPLSRCYTSKEITSHTYRETSHPKSSVTIFSPHLPKGQKPQFKVEVKMETRLYRQTMMDRR